MGISPFLGEIGVRLTPVLILSKAKPERRARNAGVVLSSEKIHERSKKAGVHRVQYVNNLFMAEIA
jgi:hypothetical protein